MLAVLWPRYGQNNKLLLRDDMAEQLHQQLEAFVRLPPLSKARVEGMQRAYDVLKGYLMLAQPDKLEAGWLAKTLTNAWPKRQDVPDGLWQALSPKLLAFMRKIFLRIRNGKSNLTLNLSVRFARSCLSR